jgi:hypothetical protein
MPIQGEGFASNLGHDDRVGQMAVDLHPQGKSFLATRPVLFVQMKLVQWKKGEARPGEGLLDFRPVRGAAQVHDGRTDCKSGRHLRFPFELVQGDP